MLLSASDLPVCVTRRALVCSSREIDRYLWICGMHMKWQKDRHKENFGMNVELRRVFEQPTFEEKSDLESLLPKISIEPARRQCNAKIA